MLIGKHFIGEEQARLIERRMRKNERIACNPYLNSCRKIEGGMNGKFSL
jgi:hypothetical protein